MDFDFLMVGTERQYKGKKYMFIKSINKDFELVVEIGAETPAPALVIPIAKEQGDK